MLCKIMTCLNKTGTLLQRMMGMTFVLKTNYQIKRIGTTLGMGVGGGRGHWRTMGTSALITRNSTMGKGGGGA